jgi:hypothetical protein
MTALILITFLGFVGICFILINITSRLEELEIRIAHIEHLIETADD